MKKMVKALMAGLMATGCLIACGETETVNGVTWTYTRESDGVSIVSVKLDTSESITIPDTLSNKPVKHIRHHVCLGCELTSVKIPASVKTIDERAFGCCLGLKKFIVSPDNPRYKAESGLLLTKDGTSLLAVACGLKHVTIPTSVTAISAGAFEGCVLLEELAIPSHVTSIGDHVFEGCTSLKEFDVSPDNPNYKADGGLLLTKDGTTIVAAAGRLTHVVIPPGVTQIGLLAFAHRRGLTKLTIPDSVTRIKELAFIGCDGALFDERTIPGLKMVDGWVIGHSGNVPTTLDLTGARGIADGAFKGCSELMHVTIPAHLKHIGQQEFVGCDRLTAISVAAGNTNYSSTNGLLLSKDGKEVIKGFNGNVSIPPSVKKINKGAFNGCSGLTHLEIPAGVTDIEPWAFKDCANLTHVTIPQSVTRIGLGAFEGCDETLFDVTTFPGLKMVDGWVVGARKDVSGSVNLTGVRGVGDCAFINCRDLMSVTIPENVTSIGGAAFRNCSGLTSVTIPTNVIRFGWYAFAGCTGLKSLTIPQGVTYIGRGTFKDCKGLASLTIHAGVTHISDDAFEGCDLKELIVAKGNPRYFMDGGSLCDRKTGKKIRVIKK